MRREAGPFVEKKSRARLMSVPEVLREGPRAACGALCYTGSLPPRFTMYDDFDEAQEKMAVVESNTGPALLEQTRGLGNRTGGVLRPW